MSLALCANLGTSNHIQKALGLLIRYSYQDQGMKLLVTMYVRRDQEVVMVQDTPLDTSQFFTKSTGSSASLDDDVCSGGPNHLELFF